MDTEAPSATHHEVDVAIIGGGLAGLTAADALLHAGKTVLLLEARHEIGGKVQNRTLQHGGVAEIGAEFVGPTQDAVLAMIKELGLKTFPTYDDGNYLIWRNGKKRAYGKSILMDNLPPLSWLGLLQVGVALWKLDRMAAQIDVKAPWSHPKAKTWDSVSFEEWGKRWGCLADANFMLDVSARELWGVEMKDMSLFYVVCYIASAGNETTKGTFERLGSVKNGAQEWRVEGGTGLIPQRLAERIGPKNIVVNAPVSHVVSSEGLHKIEWASGSATAKQVVVAMAPPLVKKITFEPALPESRRLLNEGMQIGQLGKILAVYKKPFWRNDGLNGQDFMDEGIVRMVMDGSPEDGSIGILVGFFQDDGMRLIDKMSTEEVNAQVLAELVKHYGPEAAEVSEIVVQKWCDEEHIWGGPVSVAPKNLLSKHGAALRESVGGIHFAGTETSEYWPGYMDGAIRSGKRVAADALNSFN